MKGEDELDDRDLGVPSLLFESLVLIVHAGHREKPTTGYGQISTFS